MVIIIYSAKHWHGQIPLQTTLAKNIGNLASLANKEIYIFREQDTFTDMHLQYILH